MLTTTSDMSCVRLDSAGQIVWPNMANGWGGLGWAVDCACVYGDGESPDCVCERSKGSAVRMFLQYGVVVQCVFERCSHLRRRVTMGKKDRY